MPKTTIAQTIGKQLLRSGTSVGAHYREADRGKSTADFISKKVMSTLRLFRVPHSAFYIP
jgi:four helix bundle protein